jgi:hypothetical protein
MSWGRITEADHLLKSPTCACAQTPIRCRRLPWRRRRHGAGGVSQALASTGLVQSRGRCRSWRTDLRSARGPGVRRCQPAAAQMKGRQRYEGFVETLRQLQKGQSLLHEIPEDVDNRSRRTVARPESEPLLDQSGSPRSGKDDETRGVACFREQVLRIVAALVPLASHDIEAPPFKA